MESLLEVVLNGLKDLMIQMKSMRNEFQITPK